MMHVILTILKIIGIILLVLLAILLTVFLLLLFVPMRYRLHVRKQKDLLEIDGRMTWLLHLIRADLTVKQMHGKAVIRAAGFKLKTLYFLKKEEDTDSTTAESTAPNVASEETASESEVPKPASEETIADSTASKAASEETIADSTAPKAASEETIADSTAPKAAAEEPASENTAPNATAEEPAAESTAPKAVSGKKTAENTKPKTKPGLLGRMMNLAARILNKVLGLILQIPQLPAEVYDKIDSIQDQLCRKYDALQKKADPFLSIEAEHMLGKGIRYLRYLIRGYAPRKITGYIRFGTGSPDLTGELTGLLYVLLPEAGTGYDIEPDFYELVLDTDTLATGQIRAYRLIWVGIRLILDKEFRTLLRQIRGKDKNKTSHRGPGGLRKKAASQLAKSGVEEAA